jgi:DNA-binding beta-propeller fold protein YncE
MLLPLLFAITLPTGWPIAPAGERIDLDTFPIHAHLLPGDGQALILHSGFKPPSLVILDLKTQKLVHRTTLAEAGIQFAFDAATKEVFVPGGHQSNFSILKLENNQLTPTTTVPLDSPTGPVSTVAISAQQVAITQTLHDTVSVYDRQTKAIRRLNIKRPTRALFHNQLLYVLSTYPASLHTYSASLEPLSQIPLSGGPTDLVIHNGSLYVAASSTNYLDIVDLGNPAQPKPRQRIHLAPTLNWPVGMTPASLSLDPATNRLYITCSDANSIAVLDLKAKRLLGYLPTAWYPTFALPTSGDSVLVLNGKGERSFPNPKGPNPTVHRTMTPQPPSEIQYTPLIQNGSARHISNIAKHYAMLPVTPRSPAQAKLPKEIRHVIYIMKENRTYDQVLGDMREGKGDPSLCLFPEKITPNHHKLAREFVLFDNFYVNADVSSEGWHWSAAAIVPHSVARRWPAAYAGRNRIKTPSASPRDASKEEPLDVPPGGYLWSAALKKGLSFRNYGFFVENIPNVKPGSPIVASTSDPALLPHTNPIYAGYNPDFPDVDRARIFIEELKQFELTNSLPQLIVMVLPNDHTWGTSPGKLTPFASMADNDLALGQIVEAVSKSRFWPHTAIFVLEDDAQNGPDHIDSHRSPAYIISPYTRRGITDSSFYNTTAMLHTIEAILGLPALTHYDAASRPMSTAFSARPNLAPYVAAPAGVSLETKNPPRPNAAKLDWSKPDQIEDREFNEILWRAIKRTSPPLPTRAAFLLP